MTAASVKAGEFSHGTLAASRRLGHVAAMDEDILSEWPAWELVRITPLAVDEATAR